MSKNIVIISAVYPPEPVVSARLSSDLYHNLKDRGLSVRVIHPCPTRPNGFVFDSKQTLSPDEIVTDSFTCPQSSLMGRIRESFSFGRSCSEYIAKHHEEIALIYANSWPMFSQKAIVMTARKYGIPCIIHVQDVYPESLSNKMTGLKKEMVQSLILPMDKYILGNCTKVVAISEKMKSYLVKTRDISADKVSVVINWQDEKEFMDYQIEQKTNQKSEPLTFMYMGNIGPVAGVDLLIDAFIKANLKDAILVIAGSGSVKEQMMKKAGGYPSIEFWEVPNGKVPEIQSRADVMILPIKKGAASSSIPSKLPAYMFSAKPIIGCMDADSDTADAINQAECGWVIEPENALLLAEKMKTVAALDAAYLKENGEKALKYGLSHFSKSENLRKLTDIILTVSQKGENRLT